MKVNHPKPRRQMYDEGVGESLANVAHRISMSVAAKNSPDLPLPPLQYLHSSTSTLDSPKHLRNFIPMNQATLRVTVKLQKPAEYGS